MKAELFPDVAPLTVANFIELAEKGFYDGLTFHRVIPGFMIQEDARKVQVPAAPVIQLKESFPPTVFLIIFLTKGACFPWPGL